ncbi:hypothetical protein B0I37DRAFT_442955 [Chaetomium sp. MPI-CAGE-AT-0009]|nr:hypothetical protein B0I37DRAFT_442955 [Chaetomium sp. MPI-CAGE-AT-0009]
MVPAMGAWILTLCLAICWCWPGAEAACYYPSGRLSPNDTPCRDDTPHATCCGQGYACLSNGMCQATGEELVKSGASEFVRGACTDKTWRSSSCPLFCIEEGVDFLDGGNGVAKCENTADDLYFCINSRSAEEASCEENRKLLYFAGTPSAITTIGISPSPTTSSTTTASSSTTSEPDSSTSQGSSTSTSPRQSETASGSETQAPNDDESSSGSTNLGAIIGGAVGGAVVLVLIALGAWFLVRKRRAIRGNGSQAGHGHGQNHNYDNAMSVVAPSGYQPPGEQKLAFSDTHVHQDGYHDAYQPHVSPSAWSPEAPNAWSPQGPNGPHELGLQEARQPPRGLPMELSVERPLELPTGRQ